MPITAFDLGKKNAFPSLFDNHILLCYKLKKKLLIYIYIYIYIYALKLSFFSNLGLTLHSFSMSNSISWRPRLMKQRLVVRIPLPPLMWTCQKKKSPSFILCP
jgi:hypothetical protein